MRSPLPLLLLALLSFGAMAESLERRAELGDPGAQLRLGEYYLRKSPPDYQHAAQWLRQAARQGNGDAQLQLGRLYREGHGLPQDPVLAYAWLQLAAATDHRAGVERTLLAEEMSIDQLRRAETALERLRAEIRRRDASPAPTAEAAPPRPAAEPTAVPAPAAPTDLGGYRVQLGTFSNADNARRAAQRLRALGAEPILEPLRSGERTLTRLRAGPYPDLAAARAARDLFHEKLALEGWIVPPPFGSRPSDGP